MGSTFKRHSPVYLYRAIVASRSFDDEVVVFFEAPRDGRHEHLQRMLHLAWQVSVEDLAIYNLNSEHELLNEWAMGFVSTGDMRLFESGHNGCNGGQPDVSYLDPMRTLFFVCPPTLKRLLKAQRCLPVMRETSPHCQPVQPDSGNWLNNSVAAA